MKLLDLTLPSLAENLALDEALLDQLVEDATLADVLRLWELPTHAVIMGRSTRRDIEVESEACASLGIEVQRRVSGGASIVAGPGCLMYSLVMQSRARRELDGIDTIHTFVMNRLRDALSDDHDRIVVAGISDLAVRGDDGVLRKFSGNSLRVRKGAVLYHGTLLYNFNLSLIATCLRTPPRQPDYRSERSHEQFVTNLSASSEQLSSALISGWKADTTIDSWPQEHIARLVSQRYATTDWAENVSSNRQ